MTGNTTITGLPSGLHNVTVYAEDEFGNVGSSETVSFTIQEPESFSAVLAIFSIASVTLVGTVLLVYFKKREQ